MVNLCFRNSLQVDRAEEQKNVDLKVTSKKIRAEQEKELKGFRESLKQELKLLKHEVELVPKDRRKEELKTRKERMEGEHQLRVRRNTRQVCDLSKSTFLLCRLNIPGAAFHREIERHYGNLAASIG